MSDRFVYTTPLDPLAKPLIEELTHEYNSRYGSFYSAEGAVTEMNRYGPDLFAPPYGNFLLLVRDEVAIAGGAFMQHEDPDTVEFKRVWTNAALRRQGLARKVLLELEEQALRQGYSRIYLTTGFRQPEAVGLYLTNGYTALFDRTADPETLRKLPFEKLLSSKAYGVPPQAQAAQKTLYGA